MEEEEEERGIEDGQSPNPSPGSCQPLPAGPDSAPAIPNPPCPPEGAFPQVWVKKWGFKVSLSPPCQPQLQPGV